MMIPMIIGDVTKRCSVNGCNDGRLKWERGEKRRRVNKM